MDRSFIIDAFRDRIRAGNRFRLSNNDLGLLIEGFIELLSKAATEKKIKAFCDAEITLLEEGYPQASVAKYLTVYRKAIAAAIEAGSLKLTKTNSHHYLHQQRVTGIQEERLEHWALTYLKYTPEVYDSIDKRSQLTNRDKQLNLRLVPVVRYMALLRSFLEKQGMYEARWLATAIAGLTGRRFAEVMAQGNFCLTTHPYLLHFEGQLKTRTGHGEGYDIVTLVPAAEVLEAIQRLRQLPAVTEIAQLQGKARSEALNRFNRKLNTICSSALMQVVPPMAGKTSVSVHNLRSLYGAIAVYLFCPPLQHEYVFIQHFLGHVMDSPATGHYFRFALSDELGNLIRDKGVLLQQVSELPIGELLVSPQETPEIFEVESNMAIAAPEALMQKALPNTVPNTTDTLQSLRLEWFAALERLRVDLEDQLQAVRQESHAGWFIRCIETLERQNLALRLERDQAAASADDGQGHGAEMARLQAENAALSLELKLAQDTLDSFRHLLIADESEAVCGIDILGA